MNEPSLLIFEASWFWVSENLDDSADSSGTPKSWEILEFLDIYVAILAMTSLILGSELFFLTVISKASTV